MRYYRDITQLIGAHFGQPCILLGTGPSLMDIADVYKSIPRSVVFIGCNDVPEILPEIPLNYWVLANSVQIPVKSMRIINGFQRTSLIYADSVDPTPRKTVEEVLRSPYFGYDQRHFGGEKCAGKDGTGCPNGCINLINGRKTIQELLSAESGYKKCYSAGSTVALHMMALAVIMRCNPIFVFGVELDYKLGYADRKIEPGGYSFDQDIHSIIDDFRIIGESAKSLGIQIVNASFQSKLRAVFGYNRVIIKGKSHL